MDQAFIFAAAAVAIVGTFAWMFTAVASVVMVVRLDPDVRSGVPSWLWAAYGFELLTAPIWPLCILASMAGVLAGGVFAARSDPAARPAGLLVAAVGGVYLGMIVAMVAIVGAGVLLQPA